MFFSKLGPSVARSSRSRGLLYGGVVRLPVLSDGRLRSPMDVESAADRLDGLGFLRRRITSLAAQKGQIPKDLSGVLANPGIHRFFSIKAPNYENHHPRGEDQIPEFEREPEFEDGNAHRLGHVILAICVGLLFPAGVLIGAYLIGIEINFEQLKCCLIRGEVDRIVVSNGSVAKVYLKEIDQEDPRYKNPMRRYGFQLLYIKTGGIGSIESFEKKLKEAQEALSIDPRNYVPVSSISERICVQKFWGEAYVLLFTGLLMYVMKRWL